MPTMNSECNHLIIYLFIPPYILYLDYVVDHIWSAIANTYKK